MSKAKKATQPLQSEEVFQRSTNSWTLKGTALPTAFYFYIYFNKNTNIESKDSSKGGTPSTYPLLTTGWWSFTDKETSILHNNIFNEKIKSPFVIEDLSATKLVLIGDERVYTDGSKFRFTYTHP